MNPFDESLPLDSKLDIRMSTEGKIWVQYKKGGGEFVRRLLKKAYELLEESDNKD